MTVTVITGVSLSIAQSLLHLPVEGSLHGTMAPAVLYFGPETIWPVTSFLAAAIGIILAFWRYLVDAAKRLFTGARTGPQPEGPQVDPTDVDIRITTAGGGPGRGPADQAGLPRQDDRR